ncbi:MAG: hypothetical protein AYK22_04710 [Thermoplasmatales archaeon SG8-52-3]|nr:MAG: hypothetical protein AYK22_04710 [Thermoplasmatales archaeon SG8-52-3]
MEEGAKFKYLKVNKLQPLGNSLGVPLPPPLIKELGLKKGEDMLIYTCKNPVGFMLLRLKDLELKGFVPKKMKKSSFELSLPRELYEKLSKD